MYKIAQAFADRFGTVVDSNAIESWYEDVDRGIEYADLDGNPTEVEINVEIMGNTSPTGRPWSLEATVGLEWGESDDEYRWTSLRNARLVELGRGGEVIEVAL